jgi:hypothetical protein
MKLSGLGVVGILLCGRAADLAMRMSFLRIVNGELIFEWMFDIVLAIVNFISNFSMLQTATPFMEIIFVPVL